MASSALLPPPSPPKSNAELPRESDYESADTASQESVSLSSPSHSKRSSRASNFDPRQSIATQSSEGYPSNRGSSISSKLGSPELTGTILSRRMVTEAVGESKSVAPATPVVGRLPSGGTPKEFKLATYPPKPQTDDTMSISSFASTSSRKTRPESLLIQPTTEPLILGVALVDFNHLVLRVSSVFPPWSVILISRFAR